MLEDFSAVDALRHEKICDDLALVSAPELIIAARRNGVDINLPVHLLISELASALQRGGFVPLSELDDDQEVFVPFDTSIH